MSKTFYVTTPLYYVNAEPHIGHAYTTLAADVLVRHKRARGGSAFLLTGTDEHGANIEKVAKAAGKSPQAWSDEVAARFRTMWEALGIRFDDFIRTTEPRHEKQVQKVFERLLKSGDIYRGSYEGLYCLPCEAYYDEGELLAGNCPVHGRAVEHLREESYFFKLSRFEKPLLDYYEKHPEFLAPSWRASELTNWVKSGLKDISVSRTKVAWGIPVLSDPKHTIYVWFDALQNYITAIGYDPDIGAVPGAGGRGRSTFHEGEPSPEPGTRNRSSFEELWPADVQLVGKEIYRFHGVIWPAMLMALDLPLPRQVFAHGWWTVEGEKMSKSRGNMIDPRELVAEYGVDALRYFLFREVPFGGDGDFSREAFKTRYNADLANGLGNLTARVIQLVEKNLAGEIPRRPALEGKVFGTGVLAKQSEKIYAAMDALAFHEALGLIWEQIAELNRTVDREKPWATAKTDPEAFKFLMFDLVWSLRLISDWIAPFMPETARKMQEQLGAQAAGGWGKLAKGDSLFPRKTEEKAP